MSLAPRPPAPPLLRRAFCLSATAGQSRALAGRVSPRARSLGRTDYRVFSSGRKQIRRAITFAAYCVSRSMLASSSRPKPTPVASSEVAPAPIKGRVGMSARERVVSKWGSD